MNSNNEILSEAIAWSENGHSVVVATVVSTWGSSPRPTGSRLAADETGRFIGSVSGGCVEGAVLEAAAEVIETGQPILLKFGVADETAWSVGLACGGTVQIFVELFVHSALFKQIFDRVREGRTETLVVSLLTGARYRFDSDGRLPGLALGPAVHEIVASSRQGGEDHIVETEAGPFFIEFWRPSLRLAIIGAVHIAQALAAIASTAGYDVTIIDPRTAFATSQRFGEIKLVTEWPDTALADFGLDQRSAIVALTHDPKIDDPALILALGSEAFYIGALGSRKTAEKRRERFRAQGIAAHALSRIHGPAGFSIGAETPAEIAISIMAEITAALHSDRLAARRSAAE
jgi:xanthine dehydrogenase accessory factor